MEKVRFRDFRITPDINSVCKKDISDEEYFSSKYKQYISNSRLKYIDPNAGGSPQKFKENPKISSQSLIIGSCVHECLLQPNEFELGPKIGKPTQKLGMVMDAIPGFLKEGVGLDDAIKQAALKVDYYSSTIDTKIENIKETWNIYSKSLEELNKIPTSKIRRIVSDKDWDVINACINSCTSNENIMNLLHPTNPFGDPIESYCEDALFMDYIVTYKDKHSILPFKMKADNWTIDPDSKILTLNDLKTTGHSVNCFMEPGASFEHFSYARQMAVYSQMLWYFCMKNYGVCRGTGWQIKANMLVVETVPNYWSRAYYVTQQQLTEGKKMLNELLCRVAYAEMYGYDNTAEFV
jgi:hypothetical protein